MHTTLATDGFQVRQVCERYNALTEVAKKLGSTAGYLRGRTAKEMIADAGKLVVKAPERYLTAAAAVGFLAGILLRHRR